MRAKDARRKVPPPRTCGFARNRIGKQWFWPKRPAVVADPFHSSPGWVAKKAKRYPPPAPPRPARLCILDGNDRLLACQEYSATQVPQDLRCEFSFSPLSTKPSRLLATGKHSKGARCKPGGGGASWLLRSKAHGPLPPGKGHTTATPSGEEAWLYKAFSRALNHGGWGVGERREPAMPVSDRL